MDSFEISFKNVVKNGFNFQGTKIGFYLFASVIDF